MVASPCKPAPSTYCLAFPSPIRTSYLCPTNHVSPWEVLVTAGEVSIENNLESDGSVCPFRALLSSLDEHLRERET